MLLPAVAVTVVTKSPLPAFAEVEVVNHEAPETVALMLPLVLKVADVVPPGAR
jgi:hypothetical protein